MKQGGSTVKSSSQSMGISLTAYGRSTPALSYIQGIIPVSSKVSSTHRYITNAKINEYNLLLRELAEEKQVFYVDTENAAAVGDGSLPADAAADGIHLVKDYCEKWLVYLKTHTAPKK